MPRLLKTTLLLVLITTCLADNLTYMRVDPSVIGKRLENIPADATARLETLRSQFKSAGCAPELIVEQAVPDHEMPNLVCMVPGNAPGAIVIGARIDSPAKGDEAAVDWGTAVMLPLLAESLNSAPHHETYIFIAFSGKGSGAEYYLQHLTDEQRAQIDAMVELEKVGRTPAEYGFPGADVAKLATTSERTRGMVQSNAPNALSKVLPLAAASLKLADAPKQDNEVSTDLAREFVSAGIPAIVIHSPAFTTINPPGKMEQIRLSRTAVDPKVYSETYNLMAVYLLYLDKVYSMARAKAAENQVAATAPGAPTVPASSAPAVSSSLESSAQGPSAKTESSSKPSAAAPPPGAPTQTAVAGGSAENPVFRSTTRLVQVDVVVTDKQGKPVAGLKAEDFTVLQDGKAQRVRVFEPHAGAAARDNQGAPQNAPKLPPNVYSNHPQDATADSWTIILFDVLNTPTSDQDYARKQLLELLKTIPKGRPVALYVLTNRLVMLQGFTDEPDKLLQAAQQMLPSTSHVLTTEAQRQHDEGAAYSAARESMSSSPTSLNDNPLFNEINSNRLQQLRGLESFQIADRASFTLAAFEALSRAVSGYPGRKNLLWLSDSFPVQIMADPKQETQPWRNASSFRNALAEAGVLLSKSRIAVYPTDIRGLQGRGVDISTSASESLLYTGASNAGNYGTLIGQQTAGYTEERTTMKQIAEQTGGEAFVGTNDLKLAMQRSMDDGSTYYTLAYTPDKVDPQTAFHKIDVKVAHPDVKLAYRRGYYSQGQKAPAPAVGAAALRGALQPGMPPSTMVFFSAQVLPPNDKGKDVRIGYIVNPNSVTFTDEADQKKRLVLDCMAVAYDKEGHEVAHAFDTLDGSLQQSAYETVMARGIPAQQQIALKPGTYNLRLGVMDRSSQQIGTLDVPLVVPENASASK